MSKKIQVVVPVVVDMEIDNHDNVIRVIEAGIGDTERGGDDVWDDEAQEWRPGTETERIAAEDFIDTAVALFTRQ